MNDGEVICVRKRMKKKAGGCSAAVVCSAEKEEEQAITSAGGEEFTNQTEPKRKKKRKRGGDEEPCDDAAAAAGDEKRPSRSARRKKAKRRWLRERKELNSTSEKAAEETDPPSSSSEGEEEVAVPVVVRPGHIRFESNGSSSIADEPAVRWNGTCSKRKGQKLGLAEKPTEEDRLCWVDFEKLRPLASPAPGDVVAYRQLELSDRMEPQISPYRVGEVASYDRRTGGLVLLPLPENGTPEDGVEASVLKVDLGSLADARLVGRRGGDGSIVRAGAVVSPSPPPPCAGDGGWDEIVRALSEKKAQLSDVRNGPSYRGLRSGGLGQTVALLRASNEIRG